LPEPWAFIRHFTPNWFAVTMGTGVLALVIARLPWAVPGHMALAEVLWLFGVVLFALFTLLFLARLVLHRDTLWPMLLHPVQSMFLGAIPMGLAVLVNGLLQFGPARWGEGVYALAHGLWWLDAALALGSALLVPYLMFTRQSHALEKMTAVWLLPIVAPEVAAGAAGALAPHLDPAAARQVLVVGFILWGMSLALAFSLITLVLLRLALHKLPDTDFAATSWLPLGPLATGCLGLLSMGRRRLPHSPVHRWPQRQSWRTASAWSADWPCGAPVCGGWSSPPCSLAITSATTWPSISAGGVSPSRSGCSPWPPSSCCT